MDELPISGGIIVKLGERSAKAKAREFHLERKMGITIIVYKTYKLLASKDEGRVELDHNFFVKPVRQATESETILATSYAKENTIFNDLIAKRCFDIDIFEKNFPPAIGPTKTRTVTVFATPDNVIAELWGYMSSLMIDQGVFAPSPQDPDQFVIVNVSAEPRKSILVNSPPIIPIPSPKPTRLLSTVDADILLSSLPLPPPAEYVDVSNEVSDADERLN